MKAVTSLPDSPLYAPTSAADGQALGAGSQPPDPPTVAPDSAQAPQTETVIGSTEPLGQPHPTTPAVTHVGRYELREALGSGTFGAVYRGWDTDLKRDVAIKIPHADIVELLGGSAEYLREAQSLAQLRHPAIVAIYDLGRLDDGRCYLVTEFIDGPTLAKRLKDGGKFPPQEAAALIAMVAEALQHAHQKGFVHRDLKPANVLLDRAGRPHLADFGLALHESEQRQRMGEIAGTVPYMGPEQLLGAVHHLDGRTDIWSIGVVLYELLTGRRPFEGQKLADLVDEIQQRPAKPPRQIDEAIPESLERIVLKCLQKTVDQRYASARELADDLQRDATPAKGQADSQSRMMMVSVSCLGTVVSGSICFVAFAWATGAFLPGVSDRFTQVGTALAPVEPGVSIDPARSTLLEVTTFRLRHYREDDGQTLALGELTESSRVRFGDAVRIEAEFNQPAYCFLLAFNPDGKPQLCWPADAAVAPTAVTKLTFPTDPTDAFYLTDAAGQQAFGLVATREPLPAFAEWFAAEGGNIPWRPLESAAFARIEAPLTKSADHPETTRGEIRQFQGGAPIEALDRFLRARTPAEVVTTVGFPVSATTGFSLPQ